MRASNIAIKNKKELYMLCSRFFSTAKTKSVNLHALKIGFRTPITQLLPEHQASIQCVVDAAMNAIAGLEKEGYEIKAIEHTVLTKHSQRDNLTKIKPSEFSEARLLMARTADVFFEVAANEALSVSGGKENGYRQALTDVARSLFPHERTLLNTQFPAAAFNGFTHSIIAMHGSFGGPLETTLYKQTHDTTYFYIKPSDKEFTSEQVSKMQSDFPGISFIKLDKEEMKNAFYDTFKKLCLEKQTAVETMKVVNR